VKNILIDIKDELKNIVLKTNKTELGWIVGGQVLFGLGSLVGIKLLTTLLKPDDYGILALILTYAILFQQVIFAPLQQSALRFIAPAKEEGKMENFLEVVKKFFGKATIVIAGISLIVILFFFMNGNQTLSLILIITTFYTIFSAYKATIDSLLNALFERKLSVIFQSSELWFRYLLTAFLLYIISRDVIVVMVGFCASVIITYFIALWKFNRITSNQFVKEIKSKDTDWGKLMINYGLPFSLWGIFSWLGSASPRWILQLHSSTYAVGLFAASFQLGFYPMSLLSGVLLQYMIPIAYARAGKGDDKLRIKKVNQLITTIALIASVFVVIIFLLSLAFNDFIVALFLGSQYYDAKKFFPYFILSSGFFTVGQILSVIYLSQNKSKKLLVINILAAVVLTTLSFFLSRSYSIDGIIMAYLVSYGLYLTIMFIYVQKDKFK
jgi:O-antigen/teichoic acid export membrane protein